VVAEFKSRSRDPTQEPRIPTLQFSDRICRNADVYMHAKFQVSSFSRCGDGGEFNGGSRDHPDPV